MPLPPFDLLTCVDALAGFIDVAGSLHALGVDDRSGRVGRAAVRTPSLLAQEIVERLGRAVGFPLGVVVVHGLAGRKVVRQVLPRDPRPADIQDRIHDLAELVLAGGDPGATPGCAPRGQRWLDQRPLGVGQITRIRTAGTHQLIKLTPPSNQTYRHQPRSDALLGPGRG